MGTVVALASRGGVAIAADRQAVDDGTAKSRNLRRLVETDTVGAGVVGQPADIQTFQRELEDELRQLRIENDEEMEIDKLGRIAARLAEQSNVAAVVACHDAEGVAQLRRITPNGGVFEQTTAALGDGTELAAGQLETVDSELDIDATETTLVEILERVADRDADTGGDIDRWSLSHAPDSEYGDGD